MVIFLAGSGFNQEDNEKLRPDIDRNWGVLLTFKEMPKFKSTGGTRFVKLKNRKNGNK